MMAMDSDYGWRRASSVYPSDAPNPARFPILGLRGFIRNGLMIVIDGKKREVTISTS